MSRQQGKRTSTRDYEQRVMVGSRCPECGKVRYLSKGDAKKAARRLKGRSGRLHAYVCGEFWHLGHMPGVVVAGRMTRDEITPRRSA